MRPPKHPSEIRTPTGIGIDETRGSASDSRQPLLLDDVKRIRVEPGDKLLVTINEPVSDETIAHIKKTVEGVLQVRTLVVAGGVLVSVVKAADEIEIHDPPPAPPADTESRG